LVESGGLGRRTPYGWSARSDLEATDGCVMAFGKNAGCKRALLGSAALYTAREIRR
jgi:hypothetical protein